MRISDVPGERAFDVLGECIDAVAAIAGDKPLMDKVREAYDGGTVGQLRAIGLVLKGHKDDMTAILAAIAGQTPADYLAQRSATEVVQDAYGLMTDEDLLGFTRAAPSTVAGSRGSASTTGAAAETDEG